MKYAIKNAVLPFIYLIFMAITALGILTINEDLLWLKIILNILNLALYLVIVCLYAFKLGSDAFKVRLANDLERRLIIETGEPRPLKIKEEYKPLKGFMIGLAVCMPLIVLMLIHVIIIACGGGNGAGAVASLVYLVVYAFFCMGTGFTATAYTCLYTLVAIPVIMAAVGIPYVLGARKIELQQERIKENQKRIYGDKL